MVSKGKKTVHLVSDSRWERTIEHSDSVDSEILDEDLNFKVNNFWKSTSNSVLALGTL